MRRVAAYSLNSETLAEASAQSTYLGVRDRIRMWLIRKGADQASLTDDEFFVQLKDGRQAICQHESVESSSGKFSLFQLLEPTTQGGEFRTTICAVQSNSMVEVYCALEIGHKSTIISPISYDARCPAVIKEICSAQPGWKIGSTPYDASCHRYLGIIGGTQLALLIRDASRSIPVVVVAEDQGFQLHPDTDRRLSVDLACLANVCSINDEAAWELTRRLGQAWSCFGAAIRLYWPGAAEGSNPFSHPLWTAPRLLFRSASTEEAAVRLADQLRRQLMTVASFSIREPATILAIRYQARRAAQEQRLSEARSIEDYRRLAEDFADANDKLQKALDQAIEGRDRALADLANEKLFRSFAGDSADVEPDSVTPPATVSEAFERAKSSLSDALIFGDDCGGGVDDLTESAGPPDKILAWLQLLAEASRCRSAGTLGKSVLQWLRAKGVRVSGESETDANNPTERKKRTWHDGSSDRYFDTHMKPVEAASPDRCVRIYFEWNEQNKKYAVGWIGRHP